MLSARIGAGEQAFAFSRTPRTRHLAMIGKKIKPGVYTLRFTLDELNSPFLGFSTKTLEMFLFVLHIMQVDMEVILMIINVDVQMHTNMK